MEDNFTKLTALVKREIPAFEVRYKNECLSSKIIAVLVWIFNRKYMTEFTSTRYPRVYFPSRKYVGDDPSRAFKILAHEYVHLVDRKHQGLRFTISYLLPQIAGLVWLVLPIAALVFQPWWFALLMLIPTALHALPIPAYWRKELELRGYTMNMAINYWRYGDIRDSTIDWITEEFTGWDYYKMWPFKTDVSNRIAESIELIKSNRLDLPYRDVKRLLLESRN